jgi:hypothetical protein
VNAPRDVLSASPGAGVRGNGARTVVSPCGCIDGSTDTKFDGADATLVEWYPFSQSSFDGFPRPDEQGYILQYSYNNPRPHMGDVLWSWGQTNVHGVLAYY